jgi:acyl carrier protein
MNRTEIAAKVIDLIAEESSTLQELNADSLDRVEIVMDCEEAFRIEISDEEAESVQSVGALIDLIEKLLRADA